MMRGDAAYCEHMRMVSIALTYAKEMREGVKCLIIVVIETTSLKTFFFFAPSCFSFFNFCLHLISIEMEHDFSKD